MNEVVGVLLYCGWSFCLKKKSQTHQSMKDVSVTTGIVMKLVFRLLYLVNDSLECVRVVDSEVGEDLAVDLDTSFVEESHEL